MLPQRIIGCIEGKRPGPMLIGIGGIHGNEPAGVLALERIMKRLRSIGIHHLEFGSFLAIRGNLRALVVGQRYIDSDLNRHFKAEHQAAAPSRQLSEDQELLEIDALLRAYIKSHHPTSLFVIDLHTFSSPGGFFGFIQDRTNDWSLGTQLGIPLIKGMIQRMKGATLDYFNPNYWGLDCRAILVETGQHQDSESVEFAEAYLSRTLRLVFPKQHWLPIHPSEAIIDKRMVNEAFLYRLAFIHRIPPGANYRMHPGYRNFDYVQAGTELGLQDGKAVRAPLSGFLLMPLYQQTGSEGYFLIEAIR